MSEREADRIEAEWGADCMRWHNRVLVGNRAHWCPDWDYLPIDETTPEIEGCSCELKSDWAAMAVVGFILALVVGSIIAVGAWESQRLYDLHAQGDGQPTGDGVYVKTLPVKYYEAWVYHHPDAIILETQIGSQDTWNSTGNIIIYWKFK
jgi:hypothetical protein